MLCLRTKPDNAPASLAWLRRFSGTSSSRPFYRAVTTLDALALIETPPDV
jgi:hypothetical protein